jgi:hypothetical protein
MDNEIDQFRAAVREALNPLIARFREGVRTRPFSEAIIELERVLEASERVLDEELEVLDQLLYEELSRAIGTQDRGSQDGARTQAEVASADKAKPDKNRGIN